MSLFGERLCFTTKMSSSFPLLQTKEHPFGLHNSGPSDSCLEHFHRESKQTSTSHVHWHWGAQRDAALLQDRFLYPRALRDGLKAPHTSARGWVLCSALLPAVLEGLGREVRAAEFAALDIISVLGCPGDGAGITFASWDILHKGCPGLDHLPNTNHKQGLHSPSIQLSASLASLPQAK